LSVKLVDEPGDYVRVLVVIVAVMVKVNAASDAKSSSVSIESINTGVYALMDIPGGGNVLFSDGYEVPTGNINQTRMAIAEDSSIVIDRKKFSLNSPSS